MAIEYLYLEKEVKEPIALSKFKGLYYTFICYDFSKAQCCSIGTCGDLRITDQSGKQVALFEMQARTCYALQRRNQSALQLHEVTPPHFCMDELVWLFGFGRKQRCDSQASFEQACKDYQTTHPSQIKKQEACDTGSSLCYAVANDGRSIRPIAYYYRLADGTAWALCKKDTMYKFIAEMHSTIGKFRYPLQYVIRLFEGLTMSYPTETKAYFQQRLGYWNKGVCYADPEDF